MSKWYIATCTLVNDCRSECVESHCCKRESVSFMVVKLMLSEVLLNRVIIIVTIFLC